MDIPSKKTARTVPTVPVDMKKKTGRAPDFHFLNDAGEGLVYAGRIVN
jgi:hypothetical protein